MLSKAEFRKAERIMPMSVALFFFFGGRLAYFGTKDLLRISVHVMGIT